ncbi:PucR family transcriptional regulator [Amycolatopsis acidicola]|uniref:PucR family transcriptional regulator n=1 Tax=Amycolatopsis acidicola TaxID=2596893 RepID=A0A5N0V1X3_9PSEU|nr:helix-turn-helix domain-containing protein [Amycolatopsis acidicola]KAA9158433.1 PucR family transcriptional regulator [Amycolatopsis acidicola]
MRFHGAEPAVAGLAAAAWPGLAELAGRTFDRIVTEMAVYREEQFVSHEDLRVSCVENLDFLLRSLSEPDTPDLSRAVATGQERARQGAPLPELLRAFRIGFIEVWQRFVTLTGRDQPALVAATTAIWALMDDYTEALTVAYRDSVADLLRSRYEKRLALVEALFAGGIATEGTLWEIARLLEMSVDGTYVVVAAETPGLGQEALPGIENTLREHHLASAWRLTPDLQMGVVSVHGPGATRLITKLLEENAIARVGVSPEFTGLAGTARALHLARVALAGLSPGHPGLAQFAESPLAGLVASDPAASAQLAREVLDPLLACEDRDVLLLTLRAWFDCRGSTKLVAERVYCHPNTVRHRLKRITDQLGRSLTDPADVTELGTALRALTMFPDAGGR